MEVELHAFFDALSSITPAQKADVIDKLLAEQYDLECLTSGDDRKGLQSDLKEMGVPLGVAKKVALFSLQKARTQNAPVDSEQIEKTSGVKLRVLCQSYPETPGLAIKDYWKVDDMTIVLIADKGLKGTSNILNFNVGDGLADILPTPFWSRLQGRFGTSRYWRDEGEDVAITNAVEAIAYCLQRDSEGDVTGCTDPPSRQMIDAKL